VIKRVLAANQRMRLANQTGLIKGSGCVAVEGYAFEVLFRGERKAQLQGLIAKMKDLALGSNIGVVPLTATSAIEVGAFHVIRGAGHDCLVDAELREGLKRNASCSLDESVDGSALSKITGPLAYGRRIWKLGVIKALQPVGDWSKLPILREILASSKRARDGDEKEDAEEERHGNEDAIEELKTV